jgi:hypothetical protein
MKRKYVVPAVAAVLAAGLPALAQAQNADPKAKATYLGKIKVEGKQATLRVRYRCASGEALWVSAKQVKSRKKDPALKKEGSSKVSVAWWQSHRNKFTCDGTFHTGTFTIDKVEQGSKGTLKKGKAWVQFCVTQGQETLILSRSAYVNVK